MRLQKLSPMVHRIPLPIKLLAGTVVGGRVAVVILLFGLALGGCEASKYQDRSSELPPSAAMTSPANTARHPTPTIDNPLENSQWRLVEFQSMDDEKGTLRPEDPSLYTMRLNGDGTVFMRLNCNRASGTWSSAPSGNGTSGRFAFGPLAATRAACPPPSMDDMVARQAEFIRSYLLENDRLYLSLMADGGIFVWQRDAGGNQAVAIFRAPEDGGPRNWEVTGVSRVLNLREQPSATGRIITGYPPGTILDNLGCTQGDGQIWCDVQQLGGGPRGYVAAEFLKPAVSPDGSVARGVDDSALRAGRREFDATGNIPCAQVPGQPMTACKFGVARAGGGYATVVITKPDGHSRMIFFRMGIPIGTSFSEADGYTHFKAAKEGDLHLIRIDNERYEIPEAVVLK